MLNFDIQLLRTTLKKTAIKQLQKNRYGAAIKTLTSNSPVAARQFRQEIMRMVRYNYIYIIPIQFEVLIKYRTYLIFEAKSCIREFTNRDIPESQTGTCPRITCIYLLSSQYSKNTFLISKILNTCVVKIT